MHNMDNLAVLFDVECPVHMGQMEHGKILPCGHEICRSCLLFVRSMNRRRSAVERPAAVIGAADVVVCPTCKTCSDARRLDEWPDGKSTTGAASLNGKQRVKVQRSRSWSLRRTSSIGTSTNSAVEDVVTDLSTVESYCDESIEKLDQMVIELIGMKAATVRMRNILQDLDDHSRGVNDVKQGVSIGEICTYVQKSICMLQNELFSELHNRLPKFFNAIDLYRDIDLPVVKMVPELAPQTEDIFQFASTLIFKLPKGDYNSMAGSLAKFLQNVAKAAPGEQRPGTWVVRAGRTKAFGDTHDDFLALDFCGVGVRACFCNRDSEQVPVNKIEMKDFVADYLKKYLDNFTGDLSRGFMDENLAFKIKNRLESETRLGWHCAAGLKDEFAADSGHPVASMCTIEAQHFRVIVWQG